MLIFILNIRNGTTELYPLYVQDQEQPGEVISEVSVVFSR